MAVTPNYSWPVPVATDLVKDGYAAIADLGDAIDATVFGLPGSGLTLINTTTFSAVASQSVNDVFSATYEDYKIMVNITSVSADAQIFLKLRTGGTDSSASYYYAVQGLTALNAGFNDAQNNVSTGWSVTATDSGTNNIYAFNGDIMKPFLAVPTKLTCLSTGSTTGGTPGFNNGGGVHLVSTSYSSLSIIPVTGTFSGSVKIYGYSQ